MENRELYITLPAEHLLTIQRGLTPAQDKLLLRIAQLEQEQCRGVMIVFEGNGGYGLFKLSRQEKISS